MVGQESYVAFRAIILFVSVIVPTLQVDITLINLGINVPRGTRLTSTCRNIEPGVCCQPVLSVGAQFVEFDHLLAGDIAAVWGRPNSATHRIGCTSIPVNTQPGPGAWSWQWSMSAIYSLATGASYIKLPQRFPPTAIEAEWLEAEGMKALVLGGRKWISGSGSNIFLSPQHRIRRDTKRALRGTAYVTAPSRWTYPDTILVNATVYDDGGPGNLVYTSSSGDILNLTNLVGE